MQEACDRLLMQQDEMFDAMFLKGCVDEIERSTAMAEASSRFIFVIAKEKILKKPHVLAPALIRGEIVDHCCSYIDTIGTLCIKKMIKQ